SSEPGLPIPSHLHRGSRTSAEFSSLATGAGCCYLFGAAPCRGLRAMPESSLGGGAGGSERGGPCSLRSRQALAAVPLAELGGTDPQRLGCCHHGHSAVAPQEDCR